MMTDVFGNELEVGDEVAFMEPGYTYELKTGIILKFTPKKMLIAWIDPQYKTDTRNMETYKFPAQVVKNTTGE